MNFCRKKAQETQKEELFFARFAPFRGQSAIHNPQSNTLCQASENS